MNFLLRWRLLTPQYPLSSASSTAFISNPFRLFPLPSRSLSRKRIAKITLLQFLAKFPASLFLKKPRAHPVPNPPTPASFRSGCKGKGRFLNLQASTPFCLPGQNARKSKYFLAKPPFALQPFGSMHSATGILPPGSKAIQKIFRLCFQSGELPVYFINRSKKSNIVKRQKVPKESAIS